MTRKGQTRLVIVDSAARPNPEVRRIFPALRVAAVSKDWILDSVGAFSVKSILPYVQGGVKKEELIEAGYVFDQ